MKIDFFNKQDIYSGKILKLQTHKLTIHIIDKIKKLIQNETQSNNIFALEKILSHEDFFNISNQLKKNFSQNSIIHNFIKDILISFGFEEEYVYFDIPRLRILPTYLHTIEKAKPAFAIHRDTWYANSESQINFWIPIFPVNEKNTFAFYPNYFQKKIVNNSEDFNYDEFKQEGGFQSIAKSKIFPEALEDMNYSYEKKIKMNSGEVLIFSAQHLHATRPNLSNRTRFSFDFRIIDIRDLKLNKNLNIDNASNGSILQDFLSLKNFKNFIYE